MIKIKPSNIIITKEKDIDKYFGKLKMVDGGVEIVTKFMKDLLEINDKLQEDVNKNINPAYEVVIELEFGEDKDNNTAKIGLSADQRYRIKVSERRMFDAYVNRYFKNFVYLQDRIVNYYQNQNI